MEFWRMESRWANLTDLTDQRKPKCQSLHRGKALRSKFIQARRLQKRQEVRGTSKARLWAGVKTELAGGLPSLLHKGRQLSQKGPDSGTPGIQTCHNQTKGILGRVPRVAEVRGVWEIPVSSTQFFKINYFIYLAVLGLSCGMWDLVPWPGIKPEPPALGVWSLSHRTIREVLFHPVLLWTWNCSKT